MSMSCSAMRPNSERRCCARPPPPGDRDEAVAEHQEQVGGSEERRRAEDLQGAVAVVGDLADEAEDRLERDQRQTGCEITPLVAGFPRELPCGDRARQDEAGQDEVLKNRYCGAHGIRLYSWPRARTALLVPLRRHRLGDACA